MQVEARIADRIFKDEVEWDLTDPQNTPHSYAHGVCRDLGLSWDFAAAIAAALEQQIAEHEVSNTALDPALQLHGIEWGMGGLCRAARHGPGHGGL